MFFDCRETGPKASEVYCTLWKREKEGSRKGINISPTLSSAA